MPTGTGNDLISVRKATKAALAQAKGSGTYNEAIQGLLEAVPREALQARLEARRAILATRARARRGRATPPPPRRTPSKQVLIARVAKERWRAWLLQGVVTRLAPRRYRWNGRPRVEGGMPRVVRRPGRGLAP